MSIRYLLGPHFPRSGTIAAASLNQDAPATPPQDNSRVIPLPERFKLKRDENSVALRNAASDQYNRGGNIGDSTNATFLLVPGLNDSDGGHWQTHWQQCFGLPRVYQPDWSAPDIDTWAQALECSIGNQCSPVVIVAHSFGCLATVYLAERMRHAIKAALLVAPADPNKFELGDRVPRHALPFPSMVVASRNDPWMDFDWAQWWATCWNSRFIDLGDAGHINTQSGFGPWPRGWAFAQSLASTH